ncbi:MAG: hypothetical protein PGN07_10855 [Aeromicrobium erythreum]
METWRRTIVLQWAVLLTALVGLPWFRGGYVLSYDMVWVPRPALDRADLWGLGSALPRAVPSDGVAALLGSVVDPVVVQRVVLLGALLLAGTGAARLTARLPTAARLAAVTLAIWNPFVAERLVLGQWPLVLAYGALFWLVAAAREERWAVVALALAGTALTPVSGLLGVVALAVVSRRVVATVALGALVNAPWIVASLLNRDAREPDPQGVAAFAIAPEGPFGRLGAALSLGGVWNRDVVPDSRGLLVVALISVALWAVMVVGVVRMRRDADPLLVPLAVLGAVGLVVATAGWWGPGLLERGIEAFGPLALLRDGTRWLALLAPLQVVALAHGVTDLATRLRPTGWAVVPAVLGVLLPLAALPDLAGGVAGRLTPVDYPADWTAAGQTVASVDARGDLLVLPFTAYRAPSWNDDRKVLDPAGRFFDRDTITDDRLLVGGRLVAGEDPRASQVRRVLRGEVTPARLARLGIGVVVVDTSAPGGRAALRTVRRLDAVDRTGDLRVYAVPRARARSIEPADRWSVVAAWSAAGLVVLVAGGSLVRERRERRVARAATS